MHPTAQRFHDAAQARDYDAILACFESDIAFRSPVRFHAYTGREAVGRVFTVLLETVEDYGVVDEFRSDERVGLVFNARFGNRDVEGIHLLRFNGNGLITEITEMARPMSGVVAMFEMLAPRIRELEATAEPVARS